MEFSEAKKKKVTESLTRIGATKKCGRCGGVSFVLLDGYIRLDIQPDLENVVMGGINVPTYGVACNDCGNVSLHAVKIVTP